MSGKTCAIGLVFGLLCAGIAIAQSPAAPKAAAATKPMAFEVVSIRQNQSNAVPQMGGPQPFGPTSDGYRMAGMPLVLPILTAFPPQDGGGMFASDRIRGLPDWATKDRYDLDARIADADRADWDKPSSQATMLPAMLETMLVERCKLAAHREMKDAPVYLLVVGKSGVKFKETNPDDTPPLGTTLPGGAVLVHSNNSLDIYGTSMGFFATELTAMGIAGRTIVDRTGLTGRYNIIVKSVISHIGEQPGGAEASDPAGSIFSAVEELGLKLEPGQAPIETLVIDHIEKPSAN